MRRGMGLSSKICRTPSQRHERGENLLQAILKLHPIPERTAAAVCGFPSLTAAVDCVVATIMSGAPVARVELLDAVRGRWRRFCCAVS